MATEAKGSDSILNSNSNSYSIWTLCVLWGQVLAGLLGVEAGQDAVIRTYLYGRAKEMVDPYNKTVAEFTARLSQLRNKLGKCGIKDEGIIVTPKLGAENKTWTNVLVGNFDSISYDRNPAEILRIVYGTGDQQVPGGFFPNGANGNIAKSFLKRTP